MEQPKIKLELFFTIVLWKQIFQLLTLKEAIKEAKTEMIESGEKVEFKYPEDYVSRKLQSYPYQHYKRTLLQKLAFYERDITPTIADIQ